MLLYPSDATNINSLLQMLRDASARIPVRHLSPVESMVDSHEEYIANRLASGRISLKPNITHQGVLFRGDSNIRSPFNSKFGQNRVYGASDVVRKNIIPINIKRADFQITVESFPLYEMLKKGILLPNGRKLVMENPFGLAYAYDYATPFVGLTSDLDIAAFYAVTEYDKETHSYRPVTSGRGVLYVFELRTPFSMTVGLSTLGRYLFPRTMNQKTFLLNIKPEWDFNSGAVVTGFVFDHDEELSQRIYNQFKGGELLAPQDDFLLKKLSSFPKDTVSKSGLDRNIAENPNDNPDDIVTIVKQADLDIDTEFNPAFTYEELKDVYKDIVRLWQEMIKDVYWDGRHGSDIKKYLMDLPWNKDYSQYFELESYFNAR